jgi:hypothetical protein
MTAAHKLDYKALKTLIMEEWDPIGVKHMPEAQDEYDSYLYLLLGMILRNASETAIFNYLSDLETQHMGLNGNELITRRFAKRLYEFKPISKESL